MAINDGLVQRLPYDTVDFKALAKKDAEFKDVWTKSSGHLDFQDANTTQVLSKAILKTDFGLQLELPHDRLCPPIPNRWNYVAWIQGLLDSTSPDYSDRYVPSRQVVGLDIGVGASAIYTMLCLKARPNWTMCAVDVDKKSFDCAVRNLTLNNLVTRTKMLQTLDSNPLIPLQHLAVEKLDFTICNPPFFTSIKEMHASVTGEGKSGKPNAVCTGAEVEMVCPGGDLGFITRIVNESLILRDKVTWYSSMFGKLSSAKDIINLLKQHGITNWAVGCIEAGAATKRWIVAWSFGDYRPRHVSPIFMVMCNSILISSRVLRVLKRSPTNTYPFQLNTASCFPQVSTRSKPRTNSKISSHTLTFTGHGTMRRLPALVKRHRTSGNERTDVNI